MAKEIISSKQSVSTMIQFVFGSALVLAPAKPAGRDAWMAYLISMSLGIIIAYIYSKLITLFPGKNLYDIMEIVFGKVIGKVMIVLFTWYAFHLGALVMRNFTEFIEVVSMPETPRYVIAIAIGFFCICLVGSGIEPLVRWSAFVCPMTIVTILILTIFSIPKMDVNNLRPVLYDGIKPVLNASFLVFSFPFAETVLFTTVLSFLKNKNDAFKIYYKSFIISGVILMIIALRSILVLGIEYGVNLYFPSYSAVSIINISEFLQRFEIIVAINFMLSGIVKIGICLFAACKGTAKLLNINDYKCIAAPVGILMINISSLLYNNIMEMTEWAFNIYPYYAFLFQVIIPITLLLGAIIKLRTYSPAKVKS